MNNQSDLQTSQNKDLWDSVSITDPKNTKTINIGRPLTVIKPYSQFERATEVFGPCGIGWGWDVVRVEYTTTNDISVLIRFWHGTRDNYYEQWGQCSLYIDKAATKKDGDAFKKATTDGVTKCLSYLGFNADVFLGRFEDNKYVAEMEALHAPPKVVSDEPPLDSSEAHEEDRTWAEWTQDMTDGFSDYSSMDDLKSWFSFNEESLQHLSSSEPALFKKLMSAFSAKKEKLAND